MSNYPAGLNPRPAESVRLLEAEAETRKQEWYKAMSRWQEPRTSRNIDGSEQKEMHRRFHEAARAFHVAERDLAVARDMLENGSTEEEAQARFPLSAFLPAFETDHEGRIINQEG
jgi:hypothetical protein